MQQHDNKNAMKKHLNDALSSAKVFADRSEVVFSDVCAWTWDRVKSSAIRTKEVCERVIDEHEGQVSSSIEKAWTKAKDLCCSKTCGSKNKEKN